MAEYQITELSEVSGVTARNIRAYRERGLLDPPRRVGRSALYDERHLAQLRVVDELLRKGFTTAHISDFLASTRRGHDLADVLGLQQAIFGPPRDRAGVAIDVDVDGHHARRLLTRGLAEIVDGRLVLSNPAIADIVARAADQSRYVETIAALSDGIAGLVEDLASTVIGTLQQGLTARFGPDYVPLPEDMAELRQLVDDYRALGRRVVADQLEAALKRHLVERVSDYTTAVVLNGPWGAGER